MYKLTAKQFAEQIDKTTNFVSFRHAQKEGFMIIFRDGVGYALQVDTQDYEWVEVRYKNGSIEYWGTM